jgi:hypothetical protein
MRFKYIVYPNVRKNIEDAGLVGKIDELHEKFEGPDNYTHVMDSDVLDSIKEMGEDGYFKTLPTASAQSFKTRLQGFFGHLDVHSWKTYRGGKIVTTETNLSDVLLLSGWQASFILSPDEIWNFKRFGFSSITDFVGSVGAFMKVRNSERRPGRSGDGWGIRKNDGRTLVNEITGDGNCDFRLHQNDVTPYKTIDPFGNAVSFRPEFDEDRRGVFGYHSVEGAFLATLLKWADQVNISSELLKDGGKDFLKWTESLGQGGGTCTEHFGGYDQNPNMFFCAYEVPMPKLDEFYCTDRFTPETVFVESEGFFYGAYIGSNNELIFSAENMKNMKNKKLVSAEFQPEEFDPLLKGMFVQCARGLGRTSCRQLMGILDYKLSSDFDNAVDEKKFYKKF